MASDEGGLRANGRVPLANLLSTFTGAWTLAELGAGDRLDPYEVRVYASAVERGQGGFHGGCGTRGTMSSTRFTGWEYRGCFVSLYIIKLFMSMPMCK